MSDLRVWPKHLYSVEQPGGRIGFCAAGSRAWFAEHGLSWPDFVVCGIDADALLATGDPRAVRLVEHVKEMETQDGR